MNHRVLLSDVVGTRHTEGEYQRLVLRGTAHGDWHAISVVPLWYVDVMLGDTRVQGNALHRGTRTLSPLRLAPP